jgi:hypothetical protein
MKCVPDQDTLAIEGNDCQTATKNWKVRVVSHADTKIDDQFIGDESRLVQEHVVGSTRVGNRESTIRAWENQRGGHASNQRHELLRELDAAGGQYQRKNGRDIMIKLDGRYQANGNGQDGLSDDMVVGWVKGIIVVRFTRDGRITKLKTIFTTIPAEVVIRIKLLSNSCNEAIGSYCNY